MKENEIVATEFAKKYNGKVVGVIHGNKILKSGEKSRAGYKVEIDGNKVHVYTLRTWHNNKKAISISTIQLQEALDENAWILMSYNRIEYVCHSQAWELWAKQDNNYDVHSRYGTTEVFCKQDMFRKLDLDKYDLHRYYPD
jgi:hypothetical protein